jgi:hypothetical protein
MRAITYFQRIIPEENLLFRLAAVFRAPTRRQFFSGRRTFPRWSYRWPDQY